ncbi:hypothetical protein Hanom_Chr00s002877g01706591 [Helianthus anomalus]
MSYHVIWLPPPVSLQLGNRFPDYQVQSEQDTKLSKIETSRSDTDTGPKGK